MATLWSWVQTLDQVTRSKSAVSQVHLSRGLLSQVFAPVSVHTPWMQLIRTTYCMNDKWYAAEFWLLGVWGFFWGGRINMKTGTRSHWRCDLKSQQTPGCWRGEYIFNCLQIFSKSNKLGDVNEGMYFEKPENIFKSQQTWGCLRRKIFSTEPLVLSD